MNMRDDTIIKVTIGRDELQMLAESNCDRKLTEKELYRIKHYWWDSEGALDERVIFTLACIEYAMDNKNNEWASVDEEYDQKRKAKSNKKKYDKDSL
jgi:hypothetical protein